MTDQHRAFARVNFIILASKLGEVEVEQLEHWMRKTLGGKADPEPSDNQVDKTFESPVIKHAAKYEIDEREQENLHDDNKDVIILNTLVKEESLPSDLILDNAEIKSEKLSSRKRMRAKPRIVLGSCNCPICDKQFQVKNIATENEYRKHIFHHRVLSFRCECVYEVVNEWSIRSHVYSHHRGNFHCKKCRTEFDTVGDLATHELTHETPKLFMCELCDVTTETLNALQGHMRCVHDETPYECNICTKIFKGKMKFNSHIKRTHAELQPCSECGKLVKNIRRHLQTQHTENKDKKYHCHFCGKGFQERDKLNVHMTGVHTKERRYECRYQCGAASSERGNRKKHEITKHGQAWSTIFSG